VTERRAGVSSARYLERLLEPYRGRATVRMAHQVPWPAVIPADRIPAGRRSQLPERGSAEIRSGVPDAGQGPRPASPRRSGPGALPAVASESPSRNGSVDAGGKRREGRVPRAAADEERGDRWRAGREYERPPARSPRSRQPGMAAERPAVRGSVRSRGTVSEQPGQRGPGRPSSPGVQPERAGPAAALGANPGGGPALPPSAAHALERLQARSLGPAGTTPARPRPVRPAPEPAAVIATSGQRGPEWTGSDGPRVRIGSIEVVITGPAPAAVPPAAAAQAGQAWQAGQTAPSAQPSSGARPAPAPRAAGRLSRLSYSYGVGQA
jgi:hypothetical protein